MTFRGKKYKAAAAKLEIGRQYSPTEAVALVKETAYTKFDSTIEVHMRLGVGPRRLMPNPKAGTVAPEKDLPRAIKEAKAGRVEFRLYKTANLHVAIGKASFDATQLSENFAALMEAVVKARPAAAKGQFIRTLTFTATMGPGVRVDPLQAQSMNVKE